MKIQKTQLKEIFKESILELISEGKLEISLLNNLKITKANPRTQVQQIRENRAPQQKQRIIEKPKIKEYTGDRMLDEIISNAKTEDDMLNESVNKQTPTEEEMKDYSDFI